MLISSSSTLTSTPTLILPLGDLLTLVTFCSLLTLFSTDNWDFAKTTCTVFDSACFAVSGDAAGFTISEVVSGCGLLAGTDAGEGAGAVAGAAAEDWTGTEDGTGAEAWTWAGAKVGAGATVGVGAGFSTLLFSSFNCPFSITFLLSTVLVSLTTGEFSTGFGVACLRGSSVFCFSTTLGFSVGLFALSTNFGFSATLGVSVGFCTVSCNFGFSIGLVISIWAAFSGPAFITVFRISDCDSVFEIWLLLSFSLSDVFGVSNLGSDIVSGGGVEVSAVTSKSSLILSSSWNKIIYG